MGRGGGVNQQEGCLVVAGRGQAGTGREEEALPLCYQSGLAEKEQEEGDRENGQDPAEAAKPRCQGLGWGMGRRGNERPW